MHGTALPLLLAGAAVASAALQVDFGSSSSIKAAIKDVAFDAMSYYKGNQSGNIPGLLSNPPPSGDYYWGSASVLWSTVIDYWFYTGDDAYNAVTQNAIAFQSGSDLQHPFMPANWTASMGNDDEGLWGLVAMQAVEQGFPNAPTGTPSWLELAKALFEVQAARYSIETVCDGGLRWQLFPTSEGYNYKNTISNAVFLNLGARLARYTGNQTYAQWAEKTWDWLTVVGFIDKDFNVFDGAETVSNCSEVSKLQFSYSAGILIQAAAYMYNQTTDQKTQSTWQTRLTSLTNRTVSVFFPTNNILVERPCELTDKLTCTADMLFFKGMVLRSLASAAQLAPFLHSAVAAPLRASAEAAVKACAGGKTGRQCGFRWTLGKQDGVVGIPEELNALSAVLVGGVLADEVAGKALATSGTAVGKPGGGDGSGNGNGNGGGSGSTGGAGNGAGNGSGNNTGSQGNGDGKGNSAGAGARVGLGAVLAALAAALLLR